MPVLVLEIRRMVEAVMRGKYQVLLVRQERLYFLAAPDIELAFLMLAVGVERGVVPAFGRLHLADDPAGRLRRAARIERVAGDEPGIGEQPEQRPVVVEHLLEMRNHPLRVDAVAAEPAAELIVDPALAHAGE